MIFGYRISFALCKEPEEEISVEVVIQNFSVFGRTTRLYAAPLFLGSLAVHTHQSQLLYALSIKLPPGETDDKQRKSVKNLGFGKNPQTNKKSVSKRQTERVN
jgi:hypothetical protein